MAEAMLRKTGRTVHAHVPRTLHSGSAATQAQLRELFEQAYKKVAVFWEQRLKAIPRVVREDEQIVKCFMIEWVSVHAPSLLDQNSKTGASVGLLPSDPVVQDFIAAWERRHKSFPEW